MRGSLPWAVMATVPFVVGAGYYLNTADALASQSAPTAAEHAETVEAAKLHDCCLNAAGVLPGEVHGGAQQPSRYTAQFKLYHLNQEKEVKPAWFAQPQFSQDQREIQKRVVREGAALQDGEDGEDEVQTSLAGVPIDMVPAVEQPVENVPALVVPVEEVAATSGPEKKGTGKKESAGKADAVKAPSVEEPSVGAPPVEPSATE